MNILKNVSSFKCNLADCPPITQMILNSSSKTDIRNYEKITNFYTLDFSLLMESDVLCFVLYVLAFKYKQKANYKHRILSYY